MPRIPEVAAQQGQPKNQGDHFGPMALPKRCGWRWVCLRLDDVTPCLTAGVLLSQTRYGQKSLRPVQDGLILICVGGVGETAVSSITNEGVGEKEAAHPTG